jgi:hypothetical protein
MAQRTKQTVTQKANSPRIWRNSEHAVTYEDVIARIGETDQQNLAWLLLFACMPLKAMSILQRIELLHDVHTFCLLGGSASLAAYRNEQVMNFDLTAEAEPAVFNKRWREVESLQVIVSEAVLSCANRQPLRLPSIKVQLDIDFSQWSDADKKPSSPPFWIFPPTNICETFEPSFIYRLVVLLSKHGDSIGRCQSAGCSRNSGLYIRAKRDQQFCSNACRSREAMKRLRPEWALKAKIPKSKGRATKVKVSRPTVKKTSKGRKAHGTKKR